MSKGRAIIWCVIWSVATLGLVTWVLTRNGLSARERMSDTVNEALERIRMSAIAAHVQPAENPLAGRADAWQAGERRFQNDCAICHGREARDAGGLGARMDPPAPELAGADAQRMSDAELYHVIAHGVRMTGMPGWSDEQGPTDQKVWQLVAYIRQLPRGDAQASRD